MRDDLVPIGTYPTGVEANFVRSQLGEAGIRAFVDGDATSGLGVFAGAGGGARVLVAQGDARRAVAVLTELPDDEAPGGPVRRTPIGRGPVTASPTRQRTRSTTRP